MARDFRVTGANLEGVFLLDQAVRCAQASGNQPQLPLPPGTHCLRPARLLTLAIALVFAVTFSLNAQEDPLNKVHVNPPAPEAPPPGSAPPAQPAPVEG